MRIGVLRRNKDGIMLREGQEPHFFKHLLIEDYDSLRIYAEHFAKISSEKTVNAWMGFQSQDFRRNFNNYLIHEEQTSCGITKAVGFKIAWKNTNTSIEEYCEITDSLILKKLTNIKENLDKGKTVRVNSMGGYCTVWEEDNYEYYIEIDENQLATFINTGDIVDTTLVIKSETIIVENSPECYSVYEKTINDRFGSDNVQVLNNFKLRSTGMKDDDYINLITNGLKSGLKNICFETTGQDFFHLKKMHKLLSKVKENADICIYYTSSNPKILEMFSSIGEEIKID